MQVPNWAINRMKLKIDAPKTRQNRNNNTQNVMGWNVMKNILVRQQEHLERG